MKDSNQPPEQPPQPPQTIKCFVVPVDAMDTIRDCVKEAPFKTANNVLAFLSTLQVMDVPVGPPPNQTRQ